MTAEAPSVDRIVPDRLFTFLKKKHSLFVSGSAAINGEHKRDGEHNVYRLSYGGNIGEIERRDPEKKKKRVALVDGEHKLRELITTCLSGFCIILDLFHVLEYLWKAAHVFNEEGSEEAEEWVKSKLLMLLKGDVIGVIANLSCAYKSKKWRGTKKETLRKVITYLKNGRSYMKYDEYLAEGYPIGSGVVEGACRNLVKDRMELAGMHWRMCGAHAVLQMRSIDVNGQWESFWNYRVEKQHQELYKNYSPHDSRYAA